MNIADANRISILSFLSDMGYTPIKVRGDSYWFLSPFRNERTASFKVSKYRNVWYDHGMAEGGDMVELAMRLCNLSSVSETLRALSLKTFVLSPIQHVVEKSPSPIMQEMEVRPLNNPSLLRYFTNRHINLIFAKKYCCEVHYMVKGKPYFAAGFSNVSGGYELRNPYFKGCWGHKDITFITLTPQVQQQGCLVFEGFMDFLSYLTITHGQSSFSIGYDGDFLILNSICNINKGKPILNKYERIHCFLDHDVAGRKTTDLLFSILGDKVIDEAYKYQGYKDVNVFLMKTKI